MASATNPAPVNELKESVSELKTVLGGALKQSGKNSLKLGVLVGVVAFGAQVTLVAANAAIGAGRGVAQGIRNTRA